MGLSRALPVNRVLPTPSLVPAGLAFRTSGTLGWVVVQSVRLVNAWPTAASGAGRVGKPPLKVRRPGVLLK